MSAQAVLCFTEAAGEIQTASANSCEQIAAHLPHASVDIQAADTLGELWKASDVCTSALFPGAGHLLGSILRLNKFVKMQVGFFPIQVTSPLSSNLLHLSSVPMCNSRIHLHS